ncbi:FtsK/SpoIIIE domain-containing protein [Kineococcus xinjiangensis]|uniref:FtsK/SpoIIIE domain-containing protein n=1 Tax=Kineococcus xinjiangensis TaxID=512762 RepID=UPI001B808389|nr:FtsK/SpoIIIE domain-containing protein [Kineococcus xinjiangensis]
MLVATRRPQEPSLAARVLQNVGRLLWWAVRYPYLSLPLLAAAWIGRQFGPLPLALVLTVVTAALVLWHRHRPASFARTFLLWRRWLRRVQYARHWQPAMVGADLHDGFGGQTQVPRLGRVTLTEHGERVEVHLLHGQTPQQFMDRADAFAHSFVAQRCSVRSLGTGRVVLAFQRVDPLATVVEPAPLPADGADVDLAALPLGLREDGRPWTLGLLGRHVLLAGSAGAGKGSFLWGIIRALAPAVTEGQVQLWGVDPKMGVELSFGRSLFARYWDGDATTTPEPASDDDDTARRRTRRDDKPSDPALAELAQLLDDAVALMQDRLRRMRGTSRSHVPTTAEPLVVLVVDELAFLTAYAVDRDLDKRIDRSLRLLLSQGRAPGVLVVAGIQDPRKETLPFRDLFTFRVAMRLVEPEAVDLVLGNGARLRGAHADAIATTMPGTAYVVLDGEPEPVRVRAAWIGDDELRDLATRYPAPVPLRLVKDDTGEAAA